MDAQKLAVDNEVYKKKLSKMNAEKDIILQNSRSVLEIIQKEIHEGDQRYGTVDKETENLVTSKLVNSFEPTPQKSLLRESNY